MPAMLLTQTINCLGFFSNQPWIDGNMILIQNVLGLYKIQGSGARCPFTKGCISNILKINMSPPSTLPLGLHPYCICRGLFDFKMEQIRSSVTNLLQEVGELDANPFLSNIPKIRQCTSKSPLLDFHLLFNGYYPPRELGRSCVIKALQDPKYRGRYSEYELACYQEFSIRFICPEFICRSAFSSRQVGEIEC